MASTLTLDHHRDKQQLLACVASSPEGSIAPRCVSPVIFQSWYDLFMMPWLRSPERGAALVAKGRISLHDYCTALLV